ncbi:MAG: cation transporter [Clostridiales bacterium]|jgi:cation diffusion facilitator family transporter|nr:cation transporter [Clostridiales bacterium]
MNFLVKFFIKDYEKVEDTNVRTAYGILASIVGIICNVLLFGVKLTIGAFLNSISVMADAFNNLSDASSSVISFWGIKLASKPADEDHPFGHGRIEYISALIVAFFVIEVGITFFKNSIAKIKNPEVISFSVISVSILILSIGIKLWLGFFNRKLGKKINSSVMKATAADAFGDVITTFATICSILISFYFGYNIDGYMGLVVSIIVIIAGINIAKDTLKPLIGEAPDPEFCNAIINRVESYEGIMGSHDLIVHNYGPTRRMASIHAEVPNDVCIEDSHELVDRIEREVSKEMGTFLVIHMDPIATNDAVAFHYKTVLVNVLNEIDNTLAFHDFRLVEGKEHINLIFDLVVPYDYQVSHQDEIRNQISEKIKEADSRLQCVMTIEKSYMGKL